MVSIIKAIENRSVYQHSIEYYPIDLQLLLVTVWCSALEDL